MSEQNRTTPCSTCPFAREVSARTSGGSCVSRFVGQSVGPFVLPCHKSRDYQARREGDVPTMLTMSQCAGAAIYRSNVGVAGRMPPQIHVLPADREKVFASHAELVAAHLGVSVAEAEEMLKVATPEQLLDRELRDPGVRFGS